MNSAALNCLLRAQNYFFSASSSNESSLRESESGSAPGRARFSCLGLFQGAVVRLDIS